jgi:hypothetical protein
MLFAAMWRNVDVLSISIISEQLMEGFIKSKPSGPLRVISLQLADRFSAASTFSFTFQLSIRFSDEISKNIRKYCKKFVT